MSKVSITFRSSSRKRKRGATLSSRTPERSIGGIFSTVDDDDDCIPTKKSLVKLEDSQAKVARLKAEGNKLAEDGRFRAAMARWLEAVDLDPTNAVLYELLAQAALALYEDFNAIQYATKATELAPDWGDGFHTLARCQLNYGELALAKTTLIKAMELNDPSDELHTELSEVSRLMEQRESILAQRDQEAAAHAQDADKQQVITCFRNLSLRGHVMTQ